MSELRRDPILDQWVMIAPERGTGPREPEFEPEVDLDPSSCPFCQGNEHMTPPEVFAIRDNAEPDQPDWYVRAVPHKFPILSGHGPAAVHEAGPYQRMGGVGAHEIVIENPGHDVDLAFAPTEQIIRVINAYLDRAGSMARDERLRHAVVFRNHRRAAGSTLSHPHSQVVGLPIIPSTVREQIRHAARRHRDTGRCIFCDVIQDELACGERSILRTRHFVSLCPYASRHPFEAAIYPIQHCHDMLLMTAEQRADLAYLLQQLLLAYRSQLSNPPYNLVFHTAPMRLGEPELAAHPDELCESYHWHIQLMPHLESVAGIEAGTGLYVNPVAPEDAARTLTPSTS